jgi:hypothetical protein
MAKWGPAALPGADRIGIRRGETPLDTPLRRQRQVERISSILVYQLIDEIDLHYDLSEYLDCRLERDSALDHELLHSVGGDRFPVQPLHTVRP